jgi:transcription factor E2F3
LSPVCVLLCCRNDTIFAVKAPPGTTLEVPEPDVKRQENGEVARRYRVMLHSGDEPVEVFLVQHASPNGEAGQQQPAAPPAGMDQQALYVQEEPSMGMQQAQPQQMAAAAAAAAGGDISMEPPGNLPSAAAAAAAAAAGGGNAADAIAVRQPSSASPISLLAKAIGAGGVNASDIPVLPPGAAAGVKQEPGSSHPTVQPLGLNSPVFPPPGSLSSPGLGACASPAQAGAKWSEIDPEAWFEGDGSTLGALGDFFKNDTSIFQPSTADQHDSDLVTAW